MTDKHAAAIEAACRAHDDVAGEAVNKAAMQAGIAAFLRVTADRYAPNNVTFCLMELADELERS